MPEGTVRVQLFASLREHHGRSEKTVPLVRPSTVAALQQQLRIGSDGISCAVNQEFALPTLLIWSMTDLHGLLWRRLTNGPASETRQQFRAWCEELAKGQLSIIPEPLENLRSAPAATKGTTQEASDGQRWPLPRLLQQNDRIQRELFARLAGPWMGKDHRRGVPYLWIVNHLADGRDQASPRSFLAAIRQAAEDSRQHHGDHPLALHYDSLKRGVQGASRIRIAELAEDHPWMNGLMNPLQGLSIPCDPDQFEDRWQTARFGRIPDGPDLLERLPERLRKQGVRGVMDYLEQLGLITFMLDGRINMPDLYRVGFGLGRKGGTKPALRSSRTAQCDHDVLNDTSSYDIRYLTPPPPRG